MFELIFLLVFIATLLVTGMTMMTVFVATGVAFFIMFLLGMIGMVFKLLPWLILLLIGVWIYKQFCCQSQ
ncbi:envelope stress response protein PspG [Vibrio sp. ZSDZ34]|jgi:phage shock protein G|uniref:Envelope stress response protein PspG n=1 Tax=Vibrio gelatinilyticus TaxID=2893468 RepID=A0A9X2AXG2_9VIBR|nr:envelope stress response protein PspG [Vibrio gelatinilyticus]MCJ2378356.1 envelope stress response protein PspG [Vibrio gelatinilyticus]